MIVAKDPGGIYVAVSHHEQDNDLSRYNGLKTSRKFRIGIKRNSYVHVKRLHKRKEVN